MSTSRKEIRCAYLYADGHAVIVFEKHDRDAGTVQYCEVIERLGPECRFTGRLVIHRAEGLLKLMRQAHSIRATAPALSHGSKRTQELDIAVGHIEVGLSDHWADSVWFYDMPGTLGGPYTYQPDWEEVFDPAASHWGDTRIARIHRVKVPVQAQETAI